MDNSFSSFSIALGRHVVFKARLGLSTSRQPARAELFILFAACRFLFAARGFILFAARGFILFAACGFILFAACELILFAACGFILFPACGYILFAESGAFCLQCTFFVFCFQYGYFFRLQCFN